MGYRLWDSESKKVICSNDVYFNEAKFMQNERRLREIRRVIFQEDGPSAFGQQGRAQDEPV